MTPEEFVEEMLPEDVSFELQRKILVDFLKMPKEKRKIVVAPRRGDGKSNTRLMLYLYNLMYNDVSIKEKSND